MRDFGEWRTRSWSTSDHGENIGDDAFVDRQYDRHDALCDDAGNDAPAAREQFQGRSFHPASSAAEPKRRPHPRHDT